MGGAALDLYTSGAYTTGDLDFVGEVPLAVARRLESVGFERRGRHWLHEPGQLFLELPGTSLEPPSDPLRLRHGSVEVLIIRPEALLADRLAAWKFWRSTVDAANALRLVQASTVRMNPRLEAHLARSLDVDDERVRLRRFARRLVGRNPTPEEMDRWLAAKPRS